MIHIFTPVYCVGACRARTHVHSERLVYARAERKKQKCRGGKHRESQSLTKQEFAGTREYAAHEWATCGGGGGGVGGGLVTFFSLFNSAE